MKTELIEFQGAKIVALHEHDGIYVAVKPIVDAIGLSWRGQNERILRDAVLSSVARVIRATGSDDKNYEMICLPLDMLNGWLFGVDTNRVKPELKQKMVAYQRECYRALNTHFNTKALAQNEVYWFARRPRWAFIRRLALEGWPYRAIAKLFDPRLGSGSIANSVQAMVTRGLIHPHQLAQAQHGVSRLAAQRRVAGFGTAQLALFA